MIVSHGALTPPLVFHEFVHVEQYRQLGVDRFAELYVKGFLEGGCYEAIPLEVSAYGLEGSFRKILNRAFSVEQEVAEWLHKDEEDEVSRTDRSPFSSNRKKAFDRSFFQESLSGCDEALAHLWLFNRLPR